MFPILYEQIENGVVPQHNGLGILSDSISCEVEAEANGKYELVMEYPITGIHAQELAYRRVIKAKANFTDDPQLFRIDRIGKVMNGKVTLFCKHISYDLSGDDIVSGSAGSAAAAALLLQNNAPGYSITTDKNVSASFKIGTPGSVKSYFVGREGSFLDVFGKTEIKYNNFNVQLLQNAGQNRGVTIKYKKNLLELSQEIGSDNLFTHVRCFYADMDGNVTNGNKVSTGLTLDVDRCLIVDVSQEYDTAPTVQQLTDRATRYKNENNLTTPKNNITLDFVQSNELKDRVDLFDTVSVYYEALGITRAEVQCIRTKWDVIKEKYIETEFGDAKFDAADTIAVSSRQIADKPSISFMADAIIHATEMITGNLGGYVILHDANGDGKPDEILIMNTESPETATQVWRWNKSGLAYGNSYDGPFTKLALTADGQIVANRITSGTLNADVIKAGVLSDANGNSSINMTSGVASLKNLRAKLNFTLLGENDVVKANLNHMGTDGSQFLLYDNNNHALVDLWAHNGDGSIQLNNSSGNQRVSLAGELLAMQDSSGNRKVSLQHSGITFNDFGSFTSSSLKAKGAFYLKRSNNDNDMARITLNGYNRGELALFNENNSAQAVIYGDGAMSLTSNISMYGPTGVITCVRCDQTSSIKVKKNIKDIDDSEKILKLQAVKFDYKDENLGKDQRGFIAENVAEILPNLVSGGETPAIHYTGMIPYLQDVVKKQQKKIDDLESRLASLEKRFTDGATSTT